LPMMYSKDSVDVYGTYMYVMCMYVSGEAKICVYTSRRLHLK
jgi:hypothetical protein